MTSFAAPSLATEQAGVTTSEALYHLGAADRLRITVFNEPSLSGDFSISDSGSVQLPLIGAIHATGLTVDQLQQAITSAFADGYVNNPRVTVEVITYRPFYILGEVNKPGDYPYSAGMTVLDAIATADGFTYRGNTKVVMLRHEGETTEHQVRIDPTTTIQPGDTIRVLERFF